jgi:hypothetical protein
MRRISVIAIAVVLVGTLVVPSVWYVGRADALSIGQSDWFDGPGSDPDHQYTTATGVTTSTPGEISLDTSGGSYGDWCGTTNCDSNWTRRQNIAVNNQYSAATNYQVKVQVDYKPSMKADFSDIRFLKGDSSEEYSYMLYSKTDYTSAIFYVKVPVFGSGINDIKMYYGNANADSIEDRIATMDFADNWKSGVSCGPQGLCVNPSTVTVQNGELRFTSGNSGTGWGNDYDRSVTRSVQIDVKRDLSQYTCSDAGGSDGFGGFGFGSNGSQQNGISMNKPANCDSGGLYWDFSHIDNWAAGGFTITGPHIRSDQWVTVRMRALSSGGQTFEYSLDNGYTYAEFSGYNVSNDMSNSGFGFGTGGNDATNMTIRNVLLYKDQPDVKVALGYEEQLGGYSGSLESVVYDLTTTQTALNNVSITKSGSGQVALYVRTGSGSISSTDYKLCGLILSGEQISKTKCGSSMGQRYVQYLAVITDDSTPDTAITNISFNYTSDADNPSADPVTVSVKNSTSDNAIADGGWVRSLSPYVSWTTSSDNPGGSGIAGYCIYVGQNSSADTTTKGLIKGLASDSPLATNGQCEYATSATNFNELSNMLSGTQEETTYFVRVRAIDNAGNLSPTISQSSFKIDSTPPNPQTVFSAPPVVNSPVFNTSWLYVPGLTQVIESGSGIAGVKYCVTSLISGLGGCEANDTNWYGPSHTSGDPHDISDVFPFEGAHVTTSMLDLPRLDDSVIGVNAIRLAFVDYAGNVLVQGSAKFFQITYAASNGPQNLVVTPPSNSTNSFSFTWSPPSNLSGSPLEANYCWTVNTPITSDGNNCHWTGRGITSLANGPYATKQGVNTFYIATKDESGNFDNTKYSSINFSASTSAPGTPRNLQLSDVSIRATSTWKLAMSWDAPSTGSVGIASYSIQRSTDGTTFTDIGSTGQSNTSFVDSGLSQVRYYYRILACDNAGSCSVASNVADRTPTGRFTTPANLTADSDQPKIIEITTKTSKIQWFTDRNSDSRVQIGASSGNYDTQEIGNSTQTSAHSVNLDNLKPGTTYYIRASWTDEDGNIGYSLEKKFTTLPAPSFSDVSAKKLTVSGALIQATSSDATKITIYYGKTESFGAVKTIDTSRLKSTYEFELPSLDDGTKYFYTLTGFDEQGNEYRGDIYSFTTPARPRISNLVLETVQGQPSSTKNIRWATNVAASSEISYTPKGGKQIDVLSSKKETAHLVTIKGLLDDTEYSLTAKSTDEAGNSVTSALQSFKTSLDTRSPIIKDISIETSTKGSNTASKGQIIISWKTDELATSQIAYGQGEASQLTSKTPVDKRLSLDHVMIISNLNTSAIYKLQVISQDASANNSVSAPETAIIGRANDDIFNIIFNALRKSFGVNN